MNGHAQPERLGTAEWRHPDDFAEEHAFEEGMFWLGRSPLDSAPLGHLDDTHILIASGTRAGKGTTSIIPNLCLWKGSIVVIDPKGENATVTAARRGNGSEYCEGMKQRVFVLDPFGAADVEEKYRASFNPLDMLDPKSPTVIDDAVVIAEGIITVNENAAEASDWQQKSRSLFKTLLLHVVTHPRFEGRRNLLTVRELILHGYHEGVQQMREAGITKIPSATLLLWREIAANKPDYKYIGDTIAGAGSGAVDMLCDAPKQFYGYLGPLQENTEFLDSPLMRSVLERSDFNLEEIKTDPHGISLYLSVPERYMKHHYRWLRVMVSLVKGAMERTPGLPVSKHRTLMVLDEFAKLQQMKEIEEAVSYIAGYGLTLMFVVHDFNTLDVLYNKRWETLISNCGTKIFFSIGNNTTRKYISELIGETEIIRSTQTSSTALADTAGTSDSVTDTETEGTSESNATGRGRSSTDVRGEGMSLGQTKSETLGQSHTDTSGSGTSETEGDTTTKGWQETRSKTKQLGTSQSKSQGQTGSHSQGYTPRKLFFRNTDQHSHWLRENETKSIVDGSSSGVMKGSNRGSSKALARGVSGSIAANTSATNSLNESASDTTTNSIATGESRTVTVNKSHSDTLSENETETLGRSQSRAHAVGRVNNASHTSTDTHGENETPHLRPLIRMDEVGRMFKKPKKGEPAWALVIIGDGNPTVVHRTPYHADPFFGWLYDPHPDHAPPPKLMGEMKVVLPAVESFLAERSYFAGFEGDASTISRGDAFASVVLEGPSGKVNEELLAFAADVPEMEGVSRSEETVKLPVFAPTSGEFTRNGVPESARLDGPLELGTLTFNNRERWLNGEHPVSSIEEYQGWLASLARKEEEGRAAQERLKVEAREAEEDARRLRENAELLAQEIADAERQRAREIADEEERLRLESEEAAARQSAEDYETAKARARSGHIDAASVMDMHRLHSAQLVVASMFCPALLLASLPMHFMLAMLIATAWLWVSIIVANRFGSRRLTKIWKEFRSEDWDLMDEEARELLIGSVKQEVESERDPEYRIREEWHERNQKQGASRVRGFFGLVWLVVSILSMAMGVAAIAGIIEQGDKTEIQAIAGGSMLALLVYGFLYLVTLFIHEHYILWGYRSRLDNEFHADNSSYWRAKARRRTVYFEGDPPAIMTWLTGIFFLAGSVLIISVTSEKEDVAWWQGLLIWIGFMIAWVIGGLMLYWLYTRWRVLSWLIREG